MLAIFFPIMAFVAMGFDHVVANMFFLPLGHFIGTPGLGWDDVIRNLVIAFLGNLVGAGVFVAGIYWFLHLRGTDEAPSSRSRPTRRAPGGRGRRRRQRRVGSRADGGGAGRRGSRRG